ncbi:hypothetical protein [Burkholderia gladioli]|uniref:hypothetical protein n=1 Tax=Burkholderia gladioli TaxID=28095 RepID=UPI00163FFF44|nr:hypothetical protein [Burkholderia gladioli]
MTEPSKGTKLISVRVAERHATPYQELLAAAGQTMSDGLRAHMVEKNESYDRLGLATMGIFITFRWRDEPKEAFPEAAGDMLVKVDGGSFINPEDLDRIVFELPQFFADAPAHAEPFRIDSFYFHRVANGRSTVESTRARRNVLSFRLIEGKWRAGIFDYAGVDRREMERQIQVALESRIRNTIGAFRLGILPDARLLAPTEVARLNSTITPDMIERADHRG